MLPVSGILLYVMVGSREAVTATITSILSRAAPTGRFGCLSPLDNRDETEYLLIGDFEI